MTIQSGTPRLLSDIEPTLAMRAGTELLQLDFGDGEVVVLGWREHSWVVHPEFIPASLGYMCAQLNDRTTRTEGRVLVREPVIFSFDGMSGSVASAAPLRRIATCHYSEARRGSLTLHGM